MTSKLIEQIKSLTRGDLLIENEEPAVKKAKARVQKIGMQSAKLLDKMLKLNREASDDPSTPGLIDKALKEMGKLNKELVVAMEARDKLITKSRKKK